MKFNRRMGVMLALLALTFVQICYAGVSIHDVAPVKLNRGDGIQLDLGNGKFYDSAAYNKAIIFLEELKGASSCHRLAASTLIQTCQSLDQNTAIDVALTEVKEEYAAKVAACELSAVYSKSKDVVPKACKTFLPTKNACPPGSGSSQLCYPHITRTQVTSCISELEGRPQSWTSYSNALQNVHNTCQASRLAIDKDLMLDQLKVALETFAATTQQSQDAFEHYQAEASNSLARFQEVHQDVITTIKEDWTKMSSDLTEYTWKSYLSMFGDIAKHYGNLTNYFAQSSDAVLAKQEHALHKADQVSIALNEGAVTVTDLVQQQAAFQATASTNNLALLRDQAQLQAASEFLLSHMDMLRSVLVEEVGNLDHIVNNTNSLRILLKESTPLISLLSPLADAASFANGSVRAVLRVNLLTFACVATNVLSFVFVGRMMTRNLVLSLGAVVKALVVLHVLLYTLHLANFSQAEIGSLVRAILCSRVSGGLAIALHYSGVFDYPINQLLTSLIRRNTYTKSTTIASDSRSGLLAPPATPCRVTFAEPISREISPYQRFRGSRIMGRPRAASEEPREIPTWE